MKPYNLKFIYVFNTSITYRMSKTIKTRSTQFAIIASTSGPVLSYLKKLHKIQENLRLVFVPILCWWCSYLKGQYVFLGFTSNEIIVSFIFSSSLSSV